MKKKNNCKTIENKTFLSKILKKKKTDKIGEKKLSGNKNF